jgi:hypothetical protein
MEVWEDRIMVYSERMSVKPEEEGQSKRTLPKMEIIYTMGPEASVPGKKWPESVGDN